MLRTFVFFSFLILVSSCTRKEIEFGPVPDNNLTGLVQTDTVAIHFSTVLIDSFATGSPATYLIGKYEDPFLGSVSAAPFFQLGVPPSIPEIPETAVFDSITLRIEPDSSYYGDTSQTQQFNVYQLAQSIVTSYNDLLYNTTDFPVSASPLGSRELAIGPTTTDSVIIKLDGATGAELFHKLRNRAPEVLTEAAFKVYFKGLCIKVGAGDAGAVYGISKAISMRIHYHHNNPYPVSQVISFPALSNSLSFNQVIPDRTGSGLASSGNGITEIGTASTNGFAFSQPGTGLYLKAIFPSLQSILQTGTLKKLLKAEMIIRPSYQTFDRGALKPPASLYLATTTASNLIGNTVADSTGLSSESATFIADEIYGQNNYYRFNITASISALLATPGSAQNGFFFMHGSGTHSTERLIVNSLSHSNTNSRLLLTFLTINE